ncbi:DUF4124 domain-containing protein [Luteibacter aegosomatis]|uniref:DUF4124 domain-containing protein n=1 Tax=Luteibacter aegosomatis TaxID=2911537 RepID=UPI001FF82992|nr:DUF4124 domain-containing protein [Luteibacter aegosomatis]UPG86975.1 DUF4124 domain-containing protein [Luteibacter aegosomatis]
MRRCLVLAVLIVACPLAMAQAYKWKDPQGVTHYSDAPPPAGASKVEKLKIPTAGASPTAAATTAPVPRPAPDTRADTPANRAALCDQVRKNLTILANEKTITMDDGKGGTKPVDDATRAAELKKAQAQQTLYCPA